MDQTTEVKEDFKSWMIAFGVLLMILIILAPFRLSGLVYVMLIEAFDIGRDQASLPIFMFVLMLSLLGPVSGLIGLKIGAELTTLLGFLLAAIGFGAVFFAENFTVVIIFMGFVYGTGMTLGSCLIPNILKKHFDKNYNTVNGLVAGGSCIGAFIFPPFAIYLFDEYGTAGTFLIISGLMLNGLPISMLVMAAGRDKRVPNISQKKLLSEEQETNKMPKSQANNKIESDNNSIKDSIESGEINTDTILQVANLYKDKDSEKESNFKDDIFKKDIAEKEMNVLPENIAAMSFSKEAIEVDKSLEINDGNQNTECENSEGKFIDKSAEDISVSSNNYATLTASEANFKLNKNGGSLNSTQPNDNENKTNVLDKSCGNEQISETALPSGSPDEKHSKDSNIIEAKKQTFCNSLRIFTNPAFLVLMVMMSFLTYIVVVVWSTLIDYSRDKGVPREYEVYILMFQPFIDFIGRACLVWMVDKGYVTHTLYAMLATLVTALSVLGLIMCTTFTTLMVYSAFFALGTGAQLSIGSGLVIKYLEKEEHMMGISSRMFLYVPLCFTSAPLIGYFRNERKSYDGLYYIIMAMCFICFFITPLASRFSKARKLKKLKALEMDIVA